MEDLIQNFLKVDGEGYGYGGDGYGSGYFEGKDEGRGDGRGDGEGSIDSSGRGEGRGDGEGSIDSSGRGEGYGDGRGDGRGDGYGYGGDGFCVNYDGDRFKLTSLNKKRVFYIDSLPCHFISIKGNTAKVDIIRNDFSLFPAYIYKHINVFAHGNTIREAKADAEIKYISQMNMQEKISKFREIFKNKKKLTAEILYQWHGVLTGSCKFGRDDFIKSKSIDMNKSYTLQEFVEIAKNAYGGEILKKILNS